MTRGLTVAGALVLTALLGCSDPPSDAGHAPVAASGSPAVSKYLEALEHMAVGHHDGAREAILEALGRDPEYAPAYYALVHLYSGPLMPERVYTRLEELEAEGSACAAAFLWTRSSRRLVTDPSWAHDDGCGAFSQLLDSGTRPLVATEAAVRLSTRYPESPHFLNRALAHWAMEGDWGRVSEVTGHYVDSPVALARAVALGARDAVASGLGPDRVDGARPPGGAGRHDESPAVELTRFRSAVATLLQIAEVEGSTPQLDSVLRLKQKGEEDAWARAGGLDRLRWLDARARRDLDSGRLVDALEGWNVLMALAEERGEPELLAYVYMRRGRTHVMAGREREAEGDLLEGRAIATGTRPLYLAYEVEHNLFHLYEGQGRDSLAREAGRRFVELTHEGGLTPVRMVSAYDLGWYLQRQGELDEAEAYFAKMVADIDSLDAYHYYAGDYYERTGDLGEATRYYELEWNTGDRGRGSPALGLARVAEAIGDLDAALEWATLHDGLENPDYPEFHPILPGLLARSGRADEAARAFEEAMSLVRSRGQVRAAARLGLEWGRIELGRGAYRSAARLAVEAAAGAESVGDREVAVLARATSAAARAHSGAVAGSDAIEELERAVGAAREMGLPGLESDVRRVLADVLIASRREAEGLGELASAAALADSIARSLPDDPDRAGYRAARIEVSNRALSTLLQRTDAPARLDHFGAWSERRKSRGVAGATESLRLVDVQGRLPEGTVVVDYVVLDTAVAALLVSADDQVLVGLPTTAHELTNRVERFVSHIAPRVGSVVDLTRARFDRILATQLYVDLVEPLEPWLVGNSRLVIVPDGPLHRLPFAGLVIAGDREPGRHMVEEWTTSVALSLGRVGSGSMGVTGPVLAVIQPGGPAGPLAIGEEAAAIREAWAQGRFDLLEGTAATEAEVSRRAAAAGVLHFATHAFANAREPDYSWIQLAGAGDDDGRLHAHEVRGLPTTGSLVVLSACDTGAGRVLGGEGVLSLGRAFLQAGAAGVVASLWPVGVETADLMGAFHRRLSAGDEAAEALRRAQLDLLRSGDAEPFHWAPFVLVEG